MQDTTIQGVVRELLRHLTMGVVGADDSPSGHVGYEVDGIHGQQARARAPVHDAGGAVLDVSIRRRTVVRNLETKTVAEDGKTVAEEGGEEGR